MYLEDKGKGLTGDARIGRVKFSKTKKSIYYNGNTYQSLKGRGFKSNYIEVHSGNAFWVSGCKKDGSDRLYNERTPIHIDEDVQKEYWTTIRNLPTMIGCSIINGKK